jgi:hypothetical protein
MTARVNVVVEGQTEEVFVRELLAAHLGALGVGIVASCVTTSRSKGMRGGMTSFGRARRDISSWLLQDRGAYVTTMFDLYGLPHDFPGWDEAQRVATPAERVKVLEQALGAAIGVPRFLPYLQLHEFEAILFTDVHATDRVLSASPGRSKFKELQAIRQSVQSPEEIDDSPQTSPSHRLATLYPHYDKAFHGQLIAQSIGLNAARQECPHFHDWLSRLEALGKEAKA